MLHDRNGPDKKKSKRLHSAGLEPALIAELEPESSALTARPRMLIDKHETVQPYLYVWIEA